MLRRLRRSRVVTVVLVGVTALVVGAGGVYWFGLRDDAAAVQTPEVTSQAVAASLTTLEKSVVASGTFTPTVQEEVSFEASGTVTSVAVAAGQTVTAGQTLATIDTLTLNADLLSAKATLAAAEARLADSEDADDGSDASEAQIAANAAQVDVAQAAVDVAAEAMAGATLVAPVDGLLTDVNLAVGQAVIGSGSSSGSGTATPGASTQDGATTTTSSAQFVVVAPSWVDAPGVAVPDPLELPEPMTAWPTARLTSVSRPSTGATSVAPAIASAATSTAAWATSTCAAFAAIWASDASEPSSASSLSASLASAAASVALAESRSALRVSVSIVASVWPAVTVWPAATATEVTVPLASKLTSSWTVGVKVPLATTLFSSVVRLAATAWLVTSGVWTAAASSRSPNQYTPPAPTTRAVTPTRTTVTTRLRLSLRSMRTLTHFDQGLQDQPGRP